MRMPGGDRAVVDEAKLRGYLLNPQHPLGKHHAHLFRTLLGIDVDSAAVLAQAFRTAAREGETTLGKASVFGQKYEIRFPMSGPRGSYTVLSVWIIPTGADIPYLVTAYIE